MKYWPAILALGLLAGCARFQPQPLSPAETAAGLESRSLDNPGLKAFLETNLNRELPTWPAAKWDFEMLTLAAFYYQPSLDVARAAWAEARAGIVTAGARPNPTLGFTPQYVFNPNGAPPWLATVNLDIPIETAGKRGSRIEQARHLSESARLNIAATAWQVRNQLRVSVIDFVSAARRESLLRKQLARAGAGGRLARTKARGGRARVFRGHARAAAAAEGAAGFERRAAAAGRGPRARGGGNRRPAQRAEGR